MKDLDWRIICELSKTQNITKAAHELFMTQPALTRRLHIIEEELGVKIVERGKNGVTFTRAGKYIATCSEQQQMLRNDMERKLDFYRNDQKGILEIGTSFSFSSKRLPAILGAYKEICPDQEVELQCQRSDRLLQSIERGQFHVVFMKGNERTTLCETMIEQSYLVAVSNHPMSVEDMQYAPQVIYEKGQYNKMLIDNWWSQNFDTVPIIGAHMQFADYTFSMVKSGMGYMICFLTAEELRHLDLYQIRLCDKDGNEITRKTRMIYRDDPDQAPYIKKFIKMINERWAIQS